uniref:alpha-glucosidase n=1 Tax=Anopheles merus TaxID=30066 RepID=A0A182VKR7_ANOME
MVVTMWSTVILLSVLLIVPSLLADEHWWQHANFYQIYPRSFKDSDGDGVGDLRGIMEKVPYLRRELGIDAIWLSPIFKSPMADFGYDIADFRDIHSEFGTIADLEALATACNAEGLKLILDFVPNHSSDESEWFLKSVQKDPTYSDYYVWHPGKTLANGTRVPPSNWVSVFRGSAWEWNDVRKEYYLHQFLVKQPDLNYRNPALVQEMKDVMTFWLGKGVHGFRIDAVPYLFESLPVNGVYPDEEKSGETDDPDNPTYLVHQHTQNLDETFDMMYQWRKVVDDFKQQTQSEDIVLMAEAYTPLLNIIRLFGNEVSEGAHIPFNFEVLSNTFKDTTGQQFYDNIKRWLDVVPEKRFSNWVLGNHDNKRVSSRLGVARADLYQIALNVLPGVAVTYNGDELAMEDVFISWKDTIDPAACNSNPKDYLLYSRDPVRTPFQWDDSVSAGFSTNRTTWLPVASNYKTLNYKAQKAAPRSHVKIFKALVRLRKQRTLREGTMEMQMIGDNIIVIKRHLEGASTIITVLNFNKTTETVKLSSVFQGLPSAFEVITSSMQTNYIDGLLHPVKYYKDYLENNIRPDGRELEELRPLAISFDVIKSADGSAIVKVGNTTVVCGIKAELATPNALAPGHGFLVPNVDLSPVSSPSYRPGPPCDEAQVYSQSVADAISNARCIDLQELCISPGKLVWCLYCDLVCLDHDGCVLDAAIIALVAAFHTVNLPTIQYNSDTEETEADPSRRLPLTVDCVPVTTSFVMVAGRLIADPTTEEEKLASTTLTVTVSDGKMSFFNQSGGDPMDSRTLKKCTDSAIKRERSVKKMIQTMQRKASS